MGRGWDLLQRHDPHRHDREAFPRDNAPNTNAPPAGTVGPNVDAGFGDTHVMYPAWDPPVQAQAWAGWPVGWATPEWWSGTWDRFMSQVDTVFACIDLNSSVLSTMPVYLARRGNIFPPLPWMENPAPGIYASWEEFAKQLFWSYHLGETFVFCLAREAEDPARAPNFDPLVSTAPHPLGWPTRFVVLAPWEVDVQWEDGVGRTYRAAATGEPIDSRDILHIRYASWMSDPRGHGPLEAGRARLVAAETLSRYSTDLAARGGIPWAVITHPERLRAEQATALQQQWLNARMSAMGLPAILSGGITLETLQVNPTDMALTDMLTFNESRIAVLLGVPPFLVGLPSGGDSLTYSNVTSLFDFHWRASLRPKAQPVMSALSGWATFPGSRVELNRDEYVRPALGERAQAYAVLHGIVEGTADGGEVRAMTVAEIRERERFDGPGAAVQLTSGSAGLPA